MKLRSMMARAAFICITAFPTRSANVDHETDIAIQCSTTKHYPNGMIETRTLNIATSRSSTPRGTGR